MVIKNAHLAFIHWLGISILVRFYTYIVSIIYGGIIVACINIYGGHFKIKKSVSQNEEFVLFSRDKYYI